MIKSSTILGAALSLGLVGWLLAAESQVDAGHRPEMVSMHRMADALRAVLSASQTVFMQNIAVDDSSKVPQPSHARFLQMTGQRIATRGAEFSFALRSPWPISPQHGPQTQLEADAMKQLRKQPDQPIFSDEILGGRAYFTAVYAERAYLDSCLQCHNTHADSPRRDFRKDDFMGALVIRIPKEF